METPVTKSITVDDILAFLKEAAEDRQIISPERYLDAARNLTALLGDEIDKLSLLEQEVAQFIANEISAGKSVAMAKALVAATDEYREMKRQHAKIKQIEEMIRIAKLQARLKSDELKSW